MKTDLNARQACSMSPILFGLFIDDMLWQWKQKLKHYTHCLNNKRYVMTALFDDDQVIVADSEDSLQRATFELHLTAKEYKLMFSAH